jgi:hypothetical protein
MSSSVDNRSVYIGTWHAAETPRLETPQSDTPRSNASPRSKTSSVPRPRLLKYKAQAPVDQADCEDSGWGTVEETVDDVVEVVTPSGTGTGTDS